MVFVIIFKNLSPHKESTLSLCCPLSYCQVPLMLCQLVAQSVSSPHGYDAQLVTVTIPECSGRILTKNMSFGSVKSGFHYRSRSFWGRWLWASVLTCLSVFLCL